MIAGISAVRHRDTVDHVGISRPWRVVHRTPVQCRPAQHGAALELRVEPGQIDRPRELAWREPDEEVERQRLAHLVHEKRTQAPTVDASHELADEMAIEQRRLAVRLSRGPLRLLRRKQRAHPVPVVEELGVRRMVESHDSGLMRQNVAYRRRRQELGPVVLHRRIQIEGSAIDQPQRTDAGKRLGHRVRLHDAVGLPGPASGRVGRATPEIDHPLAVGPDGYRRAGAPL